MWDFESANTKKFFGANLKKAKTNHDKELKKTRDKFAETYPYAKLSEFEFWINLSKNGEISSKTNIVYKGPGETKLYNLTGTTWKYSWDVTSDVFKYKYSGALYWGPSKIWDPGDTVKNFEIGKGVLPFRLSHFQIFVNGDQSFSFITEPLNIKWTNSLNVKDITKVRVDRRYKEDLYFASLMAAFIISQKSGICSEHLRSSPPVPKDRNKHPKILRLLSHEEVFKKSRPDGQVRHKGDDKPNSKKPTRKKGLDKKIPSREGDH